MKRHEVTCLELNEIHLNMRNERKGLKCMNVIDEMNEGKECNEMSVKMEMNERLM